MIRKVLIALRTRFNQVDNLQCESGVIPRYQW